MTDIRDILDKIIKRHNFHNRYIAVLTALSIVVSVTVTAMLVMPADSKSGELICEFMEHTHADTCRQLVCGFAESEVTMLSEAIEDIPETELSEVIEDISATELSEEITEHVHSDECYIYICGHEEHMHIEECYEGVTPEVSEEIPAENIEYTDSNILEEPDFSVFNVLGTPLHMVYDDISQTSLFSNSESDNNTEFIANQGSILGVATHYHIFAEEVAMYSHVHGNIATNHLISCGAFGVYPNKLAGLSAVNYIRSFADGVQFENIYSSQLVIGSNYKVDIHNNNYSEYYIKAKDDNSDSWGSKLPANKFGGDYTPKILVEGSQKEESAHESISIGDYQTYINITEELDNFADLSRAIANQPSNNGAEVSFDGGENIELDFSKVDDKYIYYTLDLSEHIQSTYCGKVLKIKGITDDKFLFLTVDVGGNDKVSFSKTWSVYIDNENTFDNGEVPLDGGNCRVLYNIVNSEKMDDGTKIYRPFGEDEEGMPTDAELILGERKNGSFLVPRGYVNGAGNTNGTIIAYKFVASGETHRCDIQKEGEEINDADWVRPVAPDVIIPDDDGEEDKEETPLISVSVNKIWSDGNSNHSGENITVTLYSSSLQNASLDSFTDSEKVDTKTFGSAENWKYSFTGLPKYDDNKNPLYYYIKEAVPENCKAEYINNSGLNSNGTITVRNIKNISITVKKEWSDGAENHSDDKVTIGLYKSYNKNESVDNNSLASAVSNHIELNKASGWQGKFENLPVSDDGGLIYYYVKEISVSSGNYKAEYSANALNSVDREVTVTNVKYMDITVTKKWKNKNGADMSVSDISQIEFKLYRSFTALSTNIPSDAKEVYSGTLTSSNNWSYSVSNLPTKENGAPVYYYVEETSVPNGYNVSYPDNAFSYSGSDGNCTMQIVNTQKADSTISLYIKKEWSGVTDISGVNDYISPVDNYDKPVTVKLYRSLNTSAWAEYQTAEFTTDYTFTNLPMYNANEKPYYYRIEEVKISGYSVAYSEQEFCAKDLTSGSTKEITVTNSLIKNDLSIKKVWENGIFNGVSSIQIEIYRKKTENSLGNNTSSDTVVDSNADKEEVTAPVETTPTTTVSSSETTTTTTTSAQVSGEDKVEYDEEL